MPKETGPFLAAFIGVGGAYGVTALDDDVPPIVQDCAPCYSWDGDACIWDGTCNEADPELGCMGNAVRNKETGLCECLVNASFAPCSQDEGWYYFDNSVNVCECVQVSCPSGYYAKNIGDCRPCPDPELLATNGNCGVESDASKSNLAGRLIAVDEYNGCYLPAACSATDETGTFVLAGDCRHYSYNGGVQVAP